MAGLINELIDVLTEEISCYEELLKISKGKTDIIVGRCCFSSKLNKSRTRNSRKDYKA